MAKTNSNASKSAGAALPGGTPDRKPRRSKATRWRATVLIGVHVLAAIHIAHWMSTGSTVSPLEPSEAKEFAEHSVINAGLVFFAITILSTLILGRWFCGWACHVVALQDLSRAFLIKIGITPRPLRSKWMALVPLAAAFYMFFWPLVYRLIVEQADLPPVSYEMEKENFWETFTTSWIWAAFTFFVAGFAAIYFLGAKGFCTYACPYGAVFGVVDKLSPGRIRVTDACVECGHCTLTCTSNVDVSREVHDYGMVVDKGCMKCMDCVSVCPENALYFGFGKPALLAKPRQKKRPAKKPIPLLQEVVALTSAAFAYFAWRGFRQERDFLLSLGVAICFGFFCVTLVRLFTKKDVKWPGIVLKKDGQTTALAQLLGVGTVALIGLGIPFGLVPAYHLARGFQAEIQLAEAKSLWSQPNARPLTTEETQAAERLLESAKVVDARSGAETVRNTMSIVWAAALLGRDAELESALSRVLDVPGVNADPKLIFAKHNAAKGRIDVAEKAYRAITQEHPERSGAAVELGIMVASRGEVDEALAIAQRAIDMQPQEHLRHPLHSLRGLLFVQMQRNDEALVEFTAALTAPLYAEGHTEDHTGSVHVDTPLQTAKTGLMQLIQTGQQDAAQRLGERILELRPGDADVESFMTQTPR